MVDLLPHHRRGALKINSASLKNEKISLLEEEIIDMSTEQAQLVTISNSERIRLRSYEVIGWAHSHNLEQQREELGLEQPLLSFISSNSLIEYGQTVSMSRFVNPHISATLAFRLNLDLPKKNCTILDIKNATSVFMPCLLITDSRLKDEFINNPIARQADNGSFGALSIARRGKALTKVDIKSVIISIKYEGKTIERVSSKRLSEEPLQAVAELAGTLGKYDITVGEGDLLIPGECTVPVPLKPGKWGVEIPMLGELALTVKE